MTLLSVVVPTHNRSNYALSCIEAVLRLDAPDVQLVMTDTSSDRRLFDQLQGEFRSYLDDTRVKYVKIDEPSNLTKNHNDAMALADGEYVCVIGDDDCITAAGVDAARWAAEHGVSVVSQAVSANYAWPDFQSRLAGRGHAARLYVPRTLGGARWRDSAADLERALDRALQGTDDMPRCYHGIVQRELLEKARAQSGAYFHGSSPDMSGAVSLACLTDRYVEVDVPLSIPGASGGSNSGRSAMNTHKGDLSSDTQTSGFEEEGWTSGVPRFFSVETVWAHAGLSTLAHFRPELLAKFNYTLLAALCKVRHPEYRDIADRAAGEANLRWHDGAMPSVDLQMKLERWRRFKYLARRAMWPTAANGRLHFSGLPDVASASARYEEYAKSKEFSFQAALEQLH